MHAYAESFMVTFLNNFIDAAVCYDKTHSILVVQKLIITSIKNKMSK